MLQLWCCGCGSHETCVRLAVVADRRILFPPGAVPGWVVITAARNAQIAGFGTDSPKEMAPMAAGTVKWFNPRRGFGFIEQDDGPDVFAHFSNINDRDSRELLEGQRVEFDVADGPKGQHAENIRPL